MWNGDRVRHSGGVGDYRAHGTPVQGGPTASSTYHRALTGRLAIFFLNMPPQVLIFVKSSAGAGLSAWWDAFSGQQAMHWSAKLCEVHAEQFAAAGLQGKRLSAAPSFPQRAGS